MFAYEPVIEDALAGTITIDQLPELHAAILRHRNIDEHTWGVIQCSSECWHINIGTIEAKGKTLSEAVENAIRPDEPPSQWQAEAELLKALAHDPNKLRLLKLALRPNVSVVS